MTNLDNPILGHLKQRAEDTITAARLRKMQLRVHAPITLTCTEVLSIIGMLEKVQSMMDQQSFERLAAAV